MADNFTKADVERMVAATVATVVDKAVADALKLQQAKHLDVLEELKRASAKTEAQKEHEASRDARRAAQVALRDAARKAQGADARVLKYIVGPGQAYCEGQHYRPGEIISKPNTDDPKDLPSLDYTVLDHGGPKPAAEKKGPLTAAEMNKLDADRPKHGVLAPAKGKRPSDTEV